MPGKRKVRIRGQRKPARSKSGKVLKGPKNGKLPEAKKADRLPTRKATQAPDVKSICQCSPVVLPQDVNVSKHADDGRGNGRFVVPKEAVEDEICCPLAIL